MAHIADGVLAVPVLVTGALVSAGLLTLALRRLDEAQFPQAAVFAATFFVASLISVPIGPSTVHLLLNGLMGLLLGWIVVPALFVALLLQAVFFGHGGLTALGVNTLNLAVPALFCALLLRPLLVRPTRQRALLAGAAAGVLAVLLTGLLLAASLALSGSALVPAARVIAVAFVPLAAVEALISAVILAFLYRVEPSLLLAGQVQHG
ncbi:MAG: cobalt transporter CbiM [Chromatiaceae bacterium]|nr:MAG: cobalt transporter CbiM [Chromatiaceae bacterium]